MVHNSELTVLIRDARQHPQVGPRPHLNDDLTAIHTGAARRPWCLLDDPELSGAELCDSSRNAENWSLAFDLLTLSKRVESADLVETA